MSDTNEVGPSSSHGASEPGNARHTMREFLEAVRDYAINNPVPEGRAENRGMMVVSEFKKLNPPTFDGKADPEAAEGWLDQIYRILDVMQAPKDLWVKLATFQLVGSATHWWNSVNAQGNGNEWTWEAFKEVFLEKYFPSVYKDALYDEFFRLVQRNMSVSQYETKFEALSRYAPHVTSNPTEKIRRFVKGLRPSIRQGLVPLNLKDYYEMVSRALLIESDQADARRIAKSRKRSSEQRPARWGGKRLAQSESQQRAQSTPQVRESRSFKVQTGVCFECGQPGHYRNVCPQLGRGPSQMSSSSQGSAQPTSQPTQQIKQPS